jgi:hypothetical protein
MAKTRREKTVDYLISDGTLVSIFEEYRDTILIGTTADIAYTYCEVRLYDRYSADAYQKRQDGRLVLSRYSNDGFVPMAKGGTVTASVACLEAGTRKTKEKGIAVQTVDLKTRAGLHLNWTDIPSEISGYFTIQIGRDYLLKDALEPGSLLWGDTRVWKVTGAKPVAQEVA